MSALRSMVSDGGLLRQVQSGDVVAAAENIATLTTAGSGTLTAALLLSGILNRTGPVAGFVDTTDTAANLINALVGQYSYQAANTGISAGIAVPVGLSVRLRYINGVAFANTMGAGTGCTLVTANVTASLIKDFLIQVTNGTPQQTFAVSQTNGSPVLTGLSQFQTALLSVGQLVTGTNLSGNIISIQSGVSVTLSANATATIAVNAATFSPTYVMAGLGQMVV